MSEMVEIKDETQLDAEANALLEAARKVFLASLGALVIAQEELGNFMGDTENFINRLIEDTEAFIQKLIDRGAIAEQDGRKLIDELVEKRSTKAREAAQDLAHRAESALDKGIDEVLGRMNVPTRNDIEALTKKINTLSRKVDQLRKVQEENERVPA